MTPHFDIGLFPFLLTFSPFLHWICSLTALLLAYSWRGGAERAAGGGGDSQRGVSEPSESDSSWLVSSSSLYSEGSAKLFLSSFSRIMLVRESRDRSESVTRGRRCSIMKYREFSEELTDANTVSECRVWSQHLQCQTESHSQIIE